MEGRLLFGQISVTSCPDGGYELRHGADAARPERDLATYIDPEDAATLALYDDFGTYRPLKTAPNLRRGWRLVVDSDAARNFALDLFYPARRGAWLAYQRGQLALTPLRETLTRQTGMYRVAAKITDVQASEMVGRFCRSDGGCLRTILWSRDVSGAAPSAQLPATKFDPAVDQITAKPAVAGFIPLLCQEACNLLVAEARAVVKGERTPAGA